MYNLKKCPFCGKEPCMFSIGGKYFHVNCNTVLGGCGAISGLYDDEAEAAKKWNSRFEKKYEFTEEILETTRGTLKRIRAIKDFGTVKKGDLGGWIEKEENLSHEGLCWVAGEAKVYNDAKVRGNAIVSGRAQVFDTSRILDEATVLGEATIYDDCGVFDNATVGGDACLIQKACVFQNASVIGGAKICGEAMVYGRTFVYGNARCLGYAEVFDNAKVSGQSRITDDTRIFDNAEIRGEAVISAFSDIGGTSIIEGASRITGGKFYTSPLQIRGSRHFFNVSANDRITIGCEDHSFSYWNLNYQEVGRHNDYSEEEIEEYGKYIRLAIESQKR